MWRLGQGLGNRGVQDEDIPCSDLGSNTLQGCLINHIDYMGFVVYFSDAYVSVIVASWRPNSTSLAAPALAKGDSSLTANSTSQDSVSSDFVGSLSVRERAKDFVLRL